MKQKALITGGTGFIGSNLAARLVSEGWDVSLITRASSDLSIVAKIKDELSFFVYDGTADSLINIVKTCKPDIVFHLASFATSSHKPEDVSKLIQSNITFGSQLAEAMSHCSVLKLVNTGTYWQHYGDKPFSPVNLYSATKEAFEKILQFYIEAKGLKVITLKLYDTYGENDPRNKLLNYLLQSVVNGDSLSLSPGEQKIDLVYINDVVDAFMLAAQKLLDNNVHDHEIYGVSTGSSLSLKELVATIEKKVCKKLEIKWGGIPYRDREIMRLGHILPTLEKWKAKVSIDKGIEKLLHANKGRGNKSL